MPQTASAWTHTYLAHPQDTADSHSTAGNSHFPPPQENVNQTSRQFATLRDRPPQDLKIGATAVYTQTLPTQTEQRAPVPPQQARQRQRSGDSRDQPSVCFAPL